MEHLFSKIHPDDVSRTRAVYEAARDPARRGRFDAEYRVVPEEDRPMRWIKVRGRGVFDDVGKLDDRSLQRVLREVDARTLSLALKTAKEELRDRIMAGMSARAVTALKEEISMLGAVRVRDVEAAQAQIVAQVRALEAAGEITIGVGATEDAFIE